MRASLKYGINASSCDAFATYGILLCGPLGQPKEGMKMSKVIDLLLEKQGMDRMKSRCIFICEGMMRKLYMPDVLFDFQLDTSMARASLTSIPQHYTRPLSAAFTPDIRAAS